MKIKSKKLKTALILGGIAAFLAVSAVLSLILFRPQLAELYRRLESYIAMKKTEDFSRYDDKDGKTVIYLDSGHGGNDPGALSEFLGDKTESDINLILTKKLKAELEKLGYKVILTWDSETLPSSEGGYPLEERVSVSNSDVEADFFISIHCNSFTDPKVSGSRIYFCSDGSGYSRYLAKSISDGIGSVHGDAPRLFPMEYDEAFYVIKHTKAPSVLLETLFVSNESDAEKLLSDEWLSDEARGIAAGIKSFIE